MENLNQEQAADFAALEAAAAEPTAGQVQQEAQAEQQAASAQQRISGEIKAIFDMALPVLYPAFPSLKAIYTPEVVEQASAAVAGVCVKHGWLDGGLFQEWGEEIAAAAILLPLGYATVQGVKSDIATSKKKQINQGATFDGVAVQHQEQPASGAKSVQFGNVAQ